jgi:benzoate membrane transport protein
MAVPSDREAALVTFLTTASGMSLFGLSAAFWGLIFGMVTHWLLNARRPIARSANAATEALQPVDQ